MSNSEKQFRLKPCTRCSYSMPRLYAEGNAQKLIFEDGSEDMFFTDIVDYVCECFECGTRTDEYVLKEEAIDAWNNQDFQDVDRKAFYD